MIVRDKVSRRLLLKAGGLLVGLPLLEGLGARQARAADPVVRYAVFVRQGNGAQQASGGEPDRFWPSKLGPLSKAGLQADGRAVSELADHASKLLIVRGVNYAFSGGAGCGHADGGLQCLTAAKPDGRNANRALAMGESIDNRIVRTLEAAGREPLTLYAGQKAGYLDDVLSYRGPKDRRIAENNPANAYRRIFGLPNTSTDAQAQLALQRKSVNDVVRAEMQALMSRPGLSKVDKDRLGLHFGAIRDLEVKLACHLTQSRYEEIDAAARITSDDLIDTAVRMQMDIVALALSCGLTRAVTLQIGSGNDGTQYVVDGVKQERFHHISHRINGDGSEGSAIAGAEMKHHKIDRKFAGYFKYLLDVLSAYPTPGGTLLDEGVSVWLNDLATGPPHGSHNLPIVCAGSAGGFLKTGECVDAGNVMNNKFLNTIGAAAGVKNGAGGPLDDFGDPSLAKGLVSQMVR